MRNSLLRIAALATVSISASFAQDITGTWQGTLTVPAAKRDLRLVLKISKTNHAALKAVMYSIDQGAQGLAGTAALQASAVKITIPGATVPYEGKLDTDGVKPRRDLHSGRRPATFESEAPIRAGGLGHSGTRQAGSIPKSTISLPNPMVKASAAKSNGRS